MRYKISKLLNKNEIMSHLFLCCISEVCEEIATKTHDTGRDDIEIELIIDGHNVNPKPFFDSFYNQYEELVKREAKEMLKSKLSGKLSGMVSKISEMEEIVSDWEDDINWSVENPLIK